MNKKPKNIKSSIKTLIINFLIMTLLTNCGGVPKERLVLAGEKDRFVQVIINDKEIKNEKYGPKFVGMIEESFGHSLKMFPCKQDMVVRRWVS